MADNIQIIIVIINQTLIFFAAWRSFANKKRLFWWHYWDTLLGNWLFRWCLLAFRLNVISSIVNLSESLALFFFFLTKKKKNADTLFLPTPMRTSAGHSCPATFSLHSYICHTELLMQHSGHVPSIASPQSTLEAVVVGIPHQSVHKNVGSELIPDFCCDLPPRPVCVWVFLFWHKQLTFHKSEMWLLFIMDIMIRCFNFSVDFVHE